MPKRIPPDEGALYVKLPAAAVDKLDRAAEALGVRKKDLVAGLIAKHVDPDSQRGLTALGALSQPRRVTVELGEAGPTLGSYSFQPHDPPEVLTVEQVAALLQLEVHAVAELAEAGELPGRKLGPTWRFSRAAVLAWLAAPSK
ncbi:MAG: helix-turn-helix domain-containing protein [Kofleriaceae bacterium]